MKLFLSSLIFLTLFGSLASLSQDQAEYIASGCNSSLTFFKKFTIDINDPAAQNLMGIYATATGLPFEEVELECQARIIAAIVFFSLFILAIVAVLVTIGVVICCVLCISRG